MCENIIDYLAYPVDRPSLYSCALVCRAWLPRCRYHLFHVVHIRTQRQLRLLSKAVDRTPEISRLLTKLVLCPDLGAAALLEMSLALLRRLPRLVEFYIIPFALCRGVDFLPTRSFAQSVMRRRERLIQWDGDAYLRHTRMALQSRLIGPRVTGRAQSGVSVTSLKLCRNVFFEFYDLASILCTMPNLTHLHCCSLTLDKTRALEDPSFNPPRHETTLKKLLHLEVSLR